GALLLIGSRTMASTTEYRDYAVWVDGKESGKSNVSIVTQDDGTTVMSAKVAVRVSKAVFAYTYDVQATEWWKGGKLIGLKVHANDNGKRTELSAGLDGKNLRLKVNSTQRLLNTDVWVNSFWKLADARFHNNQVPVLDADSGKEYAGQLQYIGLEQLTVGKDALKCFHFRVTGGGNTVDLWYDDGHRLVRQEFVEQGHRTIVQLTGVRR